VPDRLRARSSVRTAVVWDVLEATLGRLAARPQGVGGGSAAGVLDVLDAGGGTGGFAVPVAELGHRVLVVDPSPDSLAALERRAAEAGVTDRIRGVQGDAGELVGLVDPDSFDVVLCHSVLEVVDDVPAAVAAIAGCLRPGGAASVLVANRNAVVLARAVAGHVAEAHHALADPDGRWGAGDPVPRRFDYAEVVALLERGGLRIDAVHGVRIFADLVPGAVVDSEPGALAALRELEAAAAEQPAFRDVATQLHVLASRS
jgi:S-adenosylmethionine-dependent methyltransferase